MAKKNQIKPLVSIGLPTYNRDRYLQQALDSLLSQDYENLEIIVSDNHSTDETSAICKQYALEDRRIKYFRNDKNIGMIGNFSKVAELATGEYFMWASDDNYWHPEAVSRLMFVYQSAEKNGQEFFLIAPDSLWLVEDCVVNYYRTYLSTLSPAWKNYLRFLIRFKPALIYGLFKLSELKNFLPLSLDPEIPSDGKGWDLILPIRLFSKTGKNMATLNFGLHFNRLDTSKQDPESKFYKYWLYPKMISRAILQGDAYSLLLRLLFCSCFLFFHYSGLSYKAWSQR